MYKIKRTIIINQFLDYFEDELNNYVESQLKLPETEVMRNERITLENKEKLLQNFKVETCLEIVPNPIEEFENADCAAIAKTLLIC